MREPRSAWCRAAGPVLVALALGSIGACATAQAPVSVPAAAPASAPASAPEAVPVPAPERAPAPQPPAKPATPPCSASPYHQFDFWIGHWDVHQPDGKLVGDNFIESILGGCALRETWNGRGGFAGTSLNAYDPIDRRWHQTWLDNQGGRLDLAGGLQGLAMVLESNDPHPEKPGSRLEQRITWTVQPDGSVRQIWSTSEDGGRNWSVVFDGSYTRRH